MKLVVKNNSSYPLRLGEEVIAPGEAKEVSQELLTFYLGYGADLTFPGSEIVWLRFKNLNPEWKKDDLSLIDIQATTQTDGKRKRLS